MATEPIHQLATGHWEVRYRDPSGRPRRMRFATKREDGCTAPELPGYWRRRAESNRCRGLCRPLPGPLGHAARAWSKAHCTTCHRAPL
jgi:hypothetical protein